MVGSGLLGEPMNLQATDFPVGHLAGSQAGDDTVGEAPGGIDVVDRAVATTATGDGKTHHRRLGQLEHQINVMDHQVQHHRNIVGAVGIWTLAARLQHHDLLSSNHLDQLTEGRVEALYVPHLQQPTCGLGGSNQIRGLVLGCRDRLLDQDVDPSVKAGHADPVMQQRRQRDAHHFHFFEEIGVVSEPAATELLHRQLAAIGIRVCNAIQLGVLEQAEHPGVMPTHVSNSDDSNADWLHGVGVTAQLLSGIKCDYFQTI